MNRLKKKAWVELAALGIMTLITIPCFIILSIRNAQGIDYLIICLLVGVPTGLFTYLKKVKKLRQYDEREKFLVQRAFYYSTGLFILYFLVISFASFFLIGGKGSVPVVLLPMMFLSGLFIAKCIESFMILAWCAKEEDEQG